MMLFRVPNRSVIFEEFKEFEKRLSYDLELIFTKLVLFTPGQGALTKLWRQHASIPPRTPVCEHPIGSSSFIEKTSRKVCAAEPITCTIG